VGGEGSSNQLAAVGVLRRLEEVPDRPFLDDGAVVHHCHPLAVTGNYAEVPRHQQEGRVQLLHCITH
jgi:hypothetical protein